MEESVKGLLRVIRKDSVSELAGVLLDFFLIFLFAKLAAELFERLRQPVVIGELLVGMLIGPHATPRRRVSISSTRSSRNSA
jgi:Kef-type K+ transport system membrane component KefB